MGEKIRGEETPEGVFAILPTRAKETNIMKIERGKEKEVRGFFAHKTGGGTRTPTTLLSIRDRGGGEKGGGGGGGHCGKHIPSQL